MGYIGRGPVKSGAFRIIDDISSSFNGSTTGFTVQHNSSNLTPGTEQNLLIAVDGVMQEPVDAFTISGSTITFTSAPASGASFWGVELGDVGGVASSVANGTVDSTQIANGAIDLAHMSVNSIDSDQYVNGSIDNEHLADDAVGADELAANAVVNASVASGAAIEFSKMENLTASRLLVSDGSGDVSVSAVTAAEILQLNGLSANVTDTNLNILTDSSSTTALHAHAAASPTFIGCRLSKSAHQTVSGSSGNFITAVTFDGTDNGFDTDNMHNPSGSNPERITINTAGVYAFGCFLALESSTSVRKVEILIGSNIYQATWYTAGGGDDRLTVSGLYNMATSGNTSYMHVRYSYYGTDSNQRVFSGATFWAYRVGSV